MASKNKNEIIVHDQPSSTYIYEWVGGKERKQMKIINISQGVWKCLCVQKLWWGRGIVYETVNRNIYKLS